MDIFLGIFYQILPYLLILAVGFIGYWLKKLSDLSGDKLSADLNRTAQLVLNQLTELGIHYAEEQGRKAKASGQKKLEGHEKLQLAVDFISMQAEAHGVGEKVKGLGGDLASLIEAKVSKGRIEGEIV